MKAHHGALLEGIIRAPFQTGRPPCRPPRPPRDKPCAAVINSTKDRLVERDRRAMQSRLLGRAMQSRLLGNAKLLSIVVGGQKQGGIQLHDGMRGRILAVSPPRIAKRRECDSLRSGSLDMNDLADEMHRLAISEAIRVLGGGPDDPHSPRPSNRYPYGNHGITLGEVAQDNKSKKTHVPHIHFSARVVEKTNDDLPPNQTYRYDYDMRFNVGSGPMAVDVDNRPIRQMTAS